MILFLASLFLSCAKAAELDSATIDNLTPITVPYVDATSTLQSSSVTPTQLGFLDATSSIQTQLNNKSPLLTFVRSLVNSSGVVSLVGDSASPGNFKYYGTNGSATLGYYALPTSAVWGSITGTLSNQTDLQSALNAKQNSLTFGNLSDSGTDGITVTNGTGAVIGSGTSVAQHVADSTHNGYLLNTDWVTFNSKEPAIASGTTSQYWRGDKTFQTLNTSVVPEGSNLYFTNARAQGAVSATSPLVDTAGVFSIPVATSSVNGYLASTDWNTFNSKQSALTFGSISTSTTGVSVGSGTNSTVGPNVTVNVQTANTSQSGLLSASDWNTFNGKGSGTVMAVSVASANGFAGSSSGGTTPALTLSTSVNGILFGNGTSVAAAIASNFPTLNQNTTGTAASVTGTNVVTNSNLSQMAADTIKGNNTGSTANAIDLTVAQVNAILPIFTSSLNGLVPSSGGGTTNFLRADGTFAAPSGTGTVTSVALALPSIFTVSGSPVTTSGTLTGSLNTESANLIFAGPGTGSAATPTFRALVAADLPASTAITALTGDGTATGPGSVPFTLATVNSNVGSFGSSTAIPTLTANAKGLITAVTTNAVVAPAGTLTGTTLASNVVSSSLTSVGTIGTGVWNGTTLAIANGGTGQTSAASAFNALSPITSTGDLILGTGVNTAGKLGIGSTGNVLTVSGGTATWASPATSGTVTSVALALPSIFTVSGSPVTSSGTLTGTLNTQAANLVFSGPATGAAASPTFRSLVAADIPTIPASQVSGLFYQTVQANGSSQTQESALNFSTNFALTTTASTSTNVDLASSVTLDTITARAANGGVTLTPNAGTGSGAGGALSSTGGTGGATGAGGAINLTGGAGGGTSGVGGAFTGTAGAGSAGNSAGGIASIVGGAGQGSAAGGAANVTSGVGGATGAGGPLNITSGAGGGTSGASGAITVATGAVTSTGNSASGAMNLTIANAGGSSTVATAGAAGNFLFTGGVGGSTSDGAATATGGTGTGVTYNLGNGGNATGTTSTTANIGGAGGGFVVVGGNGGGASNSTFTDTAGAGGPISLTGGNSGAANNGAAPGAVTLTAGSGGLNSGQNGANVALVGGTGDSGNGTGTGGGITLTGGASVNNVTGGAVGGAIALLSGSGGAAGSFGSSGAISLTTAAGSTATTTTTAGASGLISIIGGVGGANSHTTGTNVAGAGGGLTTTLGAGGIGSGAATQNTGGAGGSYNHTSGAGGIPSGGTTKIGGAAGIVSITSGAGALATAGGVWTGTAGKGGATGAGGNASLIAGAGGSTSGTGGIAALTGGAASVTGATGGAANVTGGASGATGTAGAVTIAAGTAGTNGASVTLKGTNVAASSAADVISNTNATRTAGLIHSFQNGGTQNLGIDFNGKLIIPTGGAAATAGKSTLASGTVTVSTTAVTANSIIILTNISPSGVTIGLPTVGTISAGTSFVINSETTALAVQTLDTSVIGWHIIN